MLHINLSNLIGGLLDGQITDLANHIDQKYVQPEIERLGHGNLGVLGPLIESSGQRDAMIAEIQKLAQAGEEAFIRGLEAELKHIGSHSVSSSSDPATAAAHLAAAKAPAPDPASAPQTHAPAPDAHSKAHAAPAPHSKK